MSLDQWGFASQLLLCGHDSMLVLHMHRTHKRVDFLFKMHLLNFVCHFYYDKNRGIIDNLSQGKWQKM